MAMSVLQWIKDAEWIKIAAAIATVVVAVFSVLIERELIAQEKRRAAVSRSIALYHDIVESPALKHLQEVRHTITRDLWEKYGSEVTAPQTIRRSVEVYRERTLFKERSKIRQSIDALLHSIETIYDCGDYKEKYEQNETMEIDNFCDQKTISIRFGPIMTNIFFAVRPVLYCDPFITTSFPIESKTGRVMPIVMFESLVIDHLRKNSGTDNVFRTHKDFKTRKDADGSIPQHSPIIRFSEDENRCIYYDPPIEPQGSSHFLYEEYSLIY